MPLSSSNTSDVALDDAWALLLALADSASSGTALSSGAVGMRDGQLVTQGIEAVVQINLDAPRCWSWREETSNKDPAVAEMLNIYMPLCVGRRAACLVVAHLGQSLDGRIATASGSSKFITGKENIVHTHRLRALFDAVIVGSNTATNDDPKLTTRHVAGSHPTRVVLDPQRRVERQATLFTDGLAPTLVLCDQDQAHDEPSYIGLPTEGGIMPPRAILAALHARGLSRIFIEGGGLTVSNFLADGALDRLHLCVAPMLIGSGRPSLVLPEVQSLAECSYLDVTHFRSGADILYDCQLVPSSATRIKDGSQKGYGDQDHG